MEAKSHTNVLEPATLLLGREGDAARLESAFENGARLVTLRGPVGAGKSRLAVGFAAGLSPREFPGGVFKIDLCELSDEADLCAAVTELAFSGAGDAPPTIKTTGRLLRKAGPIFLLFDNAESLLSPLASALKNWAAAAPALRCLVTTTTRVGLSGELVQPLEPLDQSSAVSLFRQRSVEARGTDFQAQPDLEQLLIDVVEHLDRLPLAIELAASLTAVFEPHELLPRLKEAMELLQSSDPTAPLRARSLRGALRSSWELLAPGARDVLLASSLFRGRASLSGIEAVLGDTSPSVARGTLLLCERSLLQVHRGEGAGTTFQMYRSIRQYAVEKLAAAEEASQFRARFAQYVLAECSGTPFDAGAISRNRGNLRQVVEWWLDGVTPDSQELAEKSLLLLGELSRMQGAVTETISLLSRSLAAEGSSDFTARLRHLRAVLLSRDGKPQLAIADYQAAFKAAEAEGDEVIHARIAVDWAGLTRHLGDPERARHLYEEARRIYEDRGDEQRAARIIASLAATFHEEGELSRAKELFEESVAVLTRAGDRVAAATTQQNLGLLLQELGDLEGAQTAFEAALKEHRDLGNRRFEGIGSFDLAGLALEKGAFGAANTRYALAHEIAVEVGDRREVGLCAAFLGVCAAKLGSKVAAEKWFTEAGTELSAVNEPSLSLALQVHRAHLCLLESTITAPELETLRSLTRETEGATGDELRFARRLLGQALGDLVDKRSFVLISRAGTWFQLPNEERVDVAKKRTLVRVLSAMAEQHLDDPKAGLGLTDMLRAGWPDQQSVTKSAKNRLHVAVATLRKLGLGAHLVRDEDRYLLEGCVVQGDDS